MSTQPDRHHGDHDALAMVRTPLQLLNAREACLHFGFTKTALLIVEYSGFGLPPFDLSHVEAADWTQVRTIDLNPIPKPFPYSWLDHPRLAGSEKVNVLRQFYRRRLFDRALRPWRGIPNLLLGNYIQGWFRHAAQQCPHAHCILLDDGTDTLRIANHRRGHASCAARAPLWRRPKVWWYQRHADWDTRQRDRVTFFSSYELDLPAGDTLVPNTYRHMRQRLRAVGKDQRCLFLGQPLVEDGYLAPEEFSRMIAAVKQSLGGFDLHYVPHRRERLAELALLLKRHEIPLLALDKAFEYYLLASPTVPAVVASFFSSALDNCRLIWGDILRIIAFHLPPASLLVAHDYVADIYKYFETVGAGRIEILAPGAAATAR